MKALPSEYKSLLGYLPAIIIQNIIEGKIKDLKVLPQHYNTKTVAVFADISGFTALSEAFSKKGRIGPEFLTYCINRYMEKMINIIGNNGGDIFKFAGDALMVIWPPDNSPDFLKNTCKRAVQCALQIQKNLNRLEITKGKFLSVKIGIGVGDCYILFIGGLFGRCEYLCVGEAMRQACESETRATDSNQIIMSEHVRAFVGDIYEYIPMGVAPGYKANDDLSYFRIDLTKLSDKEKKISTKADAFLMRSKFNPDLIKKYITQLKNFLPAAVNRYLAIGKELWCKEIRLITVMFLNIKVDLSELKDESAYKRVQKIANTCQRCIYRTKGGLNKFLMDDKGSVMLIIWGIPPFSSRTDPLQAVTSAMTILKEMNKMQLKCAMGITTGTTFSGVCGTVGNRREYSLLGEMVNLASRYMSTALTLMKTDPSSKILLDEKTKDLIQQKIRCRYMLTGKVKGFNIDFDFYEPISDESVFVPLAIDPFPFIRTHFSNAFSCVDKTIDPLMSSEYLSRPKNELVNSFKMFGKKLERQLFIEKLTELYKKKTKKIIMIKGEYGVGKSLFIRRCLYDFLQANETLGKYYINSTVNVHSPQPNFILCSYQTSLTGNIPYNGFSFIFRQMYLWLKTSVFTRESIDFIHSNDYDFEIFGDSFVKMLVKTNTLKYLHIFDEVLKNDNDDIVLSEHFSTETYGKVISIAQPFKNPKRDPFFSKMIIEYSNAEHCASFFFELISFYRAQLNIYYSHKVPLIFVVEDTHCVDENTMWFINELMSKRYENIYPFGLILSYQYPLLTIKRDTDLMQKRDDFLNDMSLKAFQANSSTTIPSVINIQRLIEKEEVENLIKSIILEEQPTQTLSTLFKIDPHLVNILIDKSFKGIPLFMRELFSNLNKRKLIQNCSDELLMTSELEDMDLMKNWIDFPVPLRIEKVCGELLDTFSEKDTIILKHASVIGNIFDLDMLFQIIPFNNFPIKDLYVTLESLEKSGVIEFLYDLHHKQKIVVCKFALPFFREVLYHRMLIEQRSEIHMAVARIMQKDRCAYFPSSIEKKVLERHLHIGHNSLIAQMDEDDSIDRELVKQNMDLNTLKIFLVKEICGKLNDMQFKQPIEDEDESESSLARAKLMTTIRTGFIDKKSDGKITWESRYFVVTQKVIAYYYIEEEFIHDKVPLASFKLKDMYKIEQLKDGTFGSRKNIFSISVTKWMKKEQVKGARSYIFSTQTVQELYSWLITLNFIKVKAFYDSYITQFGIIKLPLYKKTSESQTKKRVFSYERTEELMPAQKINITKSRKSLANIILSTQFQQQPKLKTPDESVLLKTMKFITIRTFLLIFGHIEEHIFDDDFMKRNASVLETTMVRRNSKTSHNLDKPSSDWFKTPNLYRKVYMKELEEYKAQGRRGSCNSGFDSNKNIALFINNHLNKNNQQQKIEEKDDSKSSESHKSLTVDEKNKTNEEGEENDDENGKEGDNEEEEKEEEENEEEEEIVNNHDNKIGYNPLNAIKQENEETEQDAESRTDSENDNESPRLMKEASDFEIAVLSKLKNLNLNMDCDEDYYLTISQNCLNKSLNDEASYSSENE